MASVSPVFLRLAQYDGDVDGGAAVVGAYSDHGMTWSDGPDLLAVDVDDAFVGRSHVDHPPTQFVAAAVEG